MFVGVDFELFFVVSGYMDIEILWIGGNVVYWIFFVLEFVNDDMCGGVVVIGDDGNVFVFNVLIMWFGYF